MSKESLRWSWIIVYKDREKLELKIMFIIQYKEEISYWIFDRLKGEEYIHDADTSWLVELLMEIKEFFVGE